MAKQAGPIYFTGTIGNMTFYEMEGVYYARIKSSLDRKQFLADPRFARSRASAAVFGSGSKLVKTMYYTLPKAVRYKGLYQKLTGVASRHLREGKDAATIVLLLYAWVGIKVEPLQQEVAVDGKVQDITMPGAGMQQVLPPAAGNRVAAPLSPWWVSGQGVLYQPLRLVFSGDFLLPTSPDGKDLAETVKVVRGDTHLGEGAAESYRLPV